MKRSAIILASILLTLQVLAQDYNLNDYKYRYQKFRGLGTDFSLDQNYQDKLDTNRSEKQFDFGIGPRLNYFAFVNTEDLQRITNASTGLFYGLNSNFNENIDEFGNYNSKNYNANSFGYHLNFSETNRFYKANNHFLLLNYDLRLSQNFENSNSVNDRENQSLYRLENESQKAFTNSSLNTSIGYGMGRLEYVTDAVDALFMLQDLQKKKGINFDANTIEEMAKAITHIRNQRYIDFRFRYIDQIKALDSAFTANGFDTKDIDFFTTISDNWLYNQRFNRFTGNILTFGLNTGTNWNRTVTNGSGEEFWQFPSDSTSVGYGHRTLNNWNPRASLSIDYENYKQRSLYVQRRFGFRVDHGLQRQNVYDYQLSSNQPIKNFNDTTQFSETNNLFQTTNFAAQFGYLIQPNSRNFIDIYLRLVTTLFHKNSWVERIPQIDYRVQIPLEVRYYRFINQFLAINVGFTANFAYDSFNNTDFNVAHPFSPRPYQANFWQRFNAGVSYYLF